jgi:hypothetical protein
MAKCVKCSQPIGKKSWAWNGRKRADGTCEHIHCDASATEREEKQPAARLEHRRAVTTAIRLGERGA